MKILIVALVALIAACSHTKTPEEVLSDAAMKDALIKSANTPLFEITCPPTGCQFASLKVAHPSAAAVIADAVKTISAPQQSAGERVALALIDKTGTAGMAIGLGRVVGGMFSDMRQMGSDSVNAMGLLAGKIPQAPAVNISSTTTTNTYTNNIGGDGIVGSGSIVKSPVTSSISCMFNATTGAGGSGSCPVTNTR